MMPRSMAAVTTGAEPPETVALRAMRRPQEVPQG
jgi:hypothetical protein